MNVMFCDVNPIPIKAAMNLIGFDCGECRMPLVEMNDANFEKLKACMEKYGLI